jgi:hypothetical protein
LESDEIGHREIMREAVVTLRNVYAFARKHHLAAIVLIDVDEADAEYGISCLREAPPHGKYAAVILAVGHSQFTALGAAGISVFTREKSVIFDVKGILPLGAADGRL